MVGASLARAGKGRRSVRPVNAAGYSRGRTPLPSPAVAHRRSHDRSLPVGFPPAAFDTAAFTLVSLTGTVASITQPSPESSGIVIAESSPARDYADAVRQATMFLDGRSDDLTAELGAAMEEATDDHPTLTDEPSE